METVEQKRLKRIVITGPESTGKTTLSEQLARHYNTIYIPEYAREYILKLSRPYTFNDIAHIAKKQVEQYQQYSAKASEFLFFDTFLIITKVWFKIVYNDYPEWIDDELKKNKIDLFLICYPDIPWVPDVVRENGGEMRFRLLEMYLHEIENIHVNYRIIKGNERLTSAINFIDDYNFSDR